MNDGHKLLVFSDLHCDRGAAKSIVERASQADVVIGAGDFATLRRGISETISILRTITQPCVLVPGNSESYEELCDACAGWESAHVLHGSGVVIDDIPYYGLGAAVPVTPFGDWSYDLTEDEARDKLAACPMRAILVSHSPPKGLVDVSSSGQSLGSVALRETIEARLPQWVICGHIHDSAGQTAKLGETTIINAGPNGVLIDV